jgi:hypothetical protein
MGGDYGAEVVRRGKNVRKSIPPQAPWSSHMKILSKEENVLQAFVLGCDIWTSNYIHGPLDATNNRIYNAIYSINQDLAAKYRQWMIETRLGQMMEVTKIQVGELIKDFSAGIEAAKLAAENAGMIGKWEDYGKTLQGLIDTYDLNGSNNPCAKSIELSWALDAATKKRAATALMAQVDENGCPIRPPNTLSIMFKVVETDLPGDWVEFSGYWVVYETTYDHGYNPAVICEEEGLVYGPEFYYWDVEDPQYPTSLGPFDLIQEPYTDCYYKGPATDKLGSVTCSGGVSFSCVSRLVYNQGDGASTECGDVKLYAQIECPIESA